MSAFKKEVRDFVMYAGKYGWQCTGMNGSGHWRLEHKNGAKITIPATPRSPLWRKRATGDLHKYGTPKESK